MDTSEAKLGRFLFLLVFILITRSFTSVTQRLLQQYDIVLIHDVFDHEEKLSHQWLTHWLLLPFFTPCAHSMTTYANHVVIERCFKFNMLKWRPLLFLSELRIKRSGSANKAKKWKVCHLCNIVIFQPNMHVNINMLIISINPKPGERAWM